MIAFVLGSAASLAVDLRMALDLVTPDVVVTVNAAARDYRGPLAHFATMHPENAPEWLAGRVAAGQDEPASLWCPKGLPRKDGLPWRRCESWGGSSGLFGVAVARVKLGCDRIVLCGVPIDASPHFYDSKPWQDAARYRYAWIGRRAQLRDCVRSCSGWTRQQLGEPTAEWLNGVSSEAGACLRE